MMDIDFLQGGYVVRLQDGRRFSINYFIDDLPPELRPDDSVGHREGITVEALAADQPYPKLDPDRTSWGWSDEVEEIERVSRSGSAIGIEPGRATYPSPNFGQTVIVR